MGREERGGKRGVGREGREERGGKRGGGKRGREFVSRKYFLDPYRSFE